MQAELVISSGIVVFRPPDNSQYDLCMIEGKTGRSWAFMGISSLKALCADRVSSPCFPVSTMTPLQTWPIQREYDPKGMPFRRLGPSGLRVPLFSLGGCKCVLLGMCGTLMKLLGRVDSWWNCQG